MNWITLTNEAQLEELVNRSYSTPQVIFKHSTRCGTSAMVLSRLEKSAVPSDMDFYFLDLLRHRDVSNRIAEQFSVHHESPQVLLIRNGECIYDESHMAIRMEDLAEQETH
jgi:bacillithiol system protein YtxJ